MSLIEDEQDDAALLRIEDEAIRAVEQNITPPEPGVRVTGVPKLIEEVFRDADQGKQG